MRLLRSPVQIEFHLGKSNLLLCHLQLIHFQSKDKKDLDQTCCLYPPDSSALTREGSSKVPATDPSPPSAFSQVLQGQELSTLRATFVDSNVSNSCDRPIHWAPSVMDNEKVEGSLRGRIGESSFTDLLSGFGSNNCSTNEFSTPSNEGKFNLQHSNPWTIIPSGLSLSLLGGGMKCSLQDVRFSAFDQYSVHGNQRGGGRMAPPLSSYLQMSNSHSSEAMPKSQLGKQNEIMKPKDGNCKIFGVPLAGNTNISDAAAVTAVGQRYLTFDCDQKFEQSKRLKVVENSTVGKEQHLHAKIQGVSTRSCTKVEASTNQVADQHDNQVADQQMPVYDLPAKILCRVFNVQLKAEPDTDEVFAQITLMPESNQDEHAVKKEPAPPPESQFRVHSFCKTLTASDTSTHGGFSVIRRLADVCLPPLDMSRQPPTQELVAKDLHGSEWRFRHIFCEVRMGTFVLE